MEGREKWGGEGRGKKEVNRLLKGKKEKNTIVLIHKRQN